MTASKANLSEGGTCTTLDAEPFEISGRTAGDFSLGIYTARITARRVSDGAAKTFSVRWAFKKGPFESLAEVVDLVIENVIGLPADVAALSDVTVSAIAWGENTSFRVHGLADTEIDWIFQAEGEELSHV